MLQPKPIYNLKSTLTFKMCHLCHLSAGAVCPPALLPDEATCSQYHSYLIPEGDTVDWECQLSAPPSTNFSLLLNNKTAILPSQTLVRCGNESQVIFLVQEEAQHVCLSSFSFTVFICSANETVVGEFSIIKSTGDVVAGTNITVELIQEPEITLPTQGIYTSMMIHKYFMIIS